MPGKMMSSNAYRLGTRAREPRCIKEPVSLDGSNRGSKPKPKKKVKDEPAKPPKLVINQPRYRAPTQFGRAAQHLRWQRDGTIGK